MILDIMDNYGNVGLMQERILWLHYCQVE